MRRSSAVTIYIYLYAYQKSSSANLTYINIENGCTSNRELQSAGRKELQLSNPIFEVEEVRTLQRANSPLNWKGVVPFCRSVDEQALCVYLIRAHARLSAARKKGN